ncbi:hypothetical protein F383_17066 [Gossypium arboreum]|uniref:Uncharacterized protein n=1 Tax=Gossypium arboreum TaxID=29729 RepID=A0A0B0NPU9_GOSAR|nr:hypothetical protein F383_17066 [Gossypium arboreum]
MPSKESILELIEDTRFCLLEVTMELIEDIRSCFSKVAKEKTKTLSH